jgi:phosphonate transport system ATP-binding protein
LKTDKLTPQIALESATAHYGNQQVLQAIDLRLHRGERVVLLGKSGAGKSTLLSVLHNKLIDKQETLSWIPQQHGLVENLSVFHNILMGQIDQRGRWHNIINLLRPQAQAKNDISLLLGSLDLEGQLFTPVAELSGGQKQRVAIGRALYRRSNVLLADEPIANLDKPLAVRILDLLSKRFNGFVISLHDTDLALAYSDRIIGIKAGRIVIDQPRNKISSTDLDLLYEDDSRI